MLRDRQHVFEDALAQRASTIARADRARRAADAAAEAIAADRKRFVGEVLAALQPPGTRVS